MKIVVTTPVGNVGSRVTRLLLQSGIRPTLFLRHPDRLDAETARLADVVQGDQLVADDVLSATEGADALFWITPTGRAGPAAGRDGYLVTPATVPDARPVFQVAGCRGYRLAAAAQALTTGGRARSLSQ